MLNADSAPRIDELIATLTTLPSETPVVIAMVNDNQPFSPKPKAIGLSRSTQDIVHMGSHMFDAVLDSSPVEHYAPVRRMRKAGEDGYLLSTMMIGKYKDTADNFPCNLVDNMRDPWFPTTTAQFTYKLMEMAWQGNDNLYVSAHTVTEDDGLMVGTDPAIVVGVLVSKQTGLHDVACVVADAEPLSTSFLLQHNPEPDHVIILCSLGGWMPTAFKTSAAPPKITERSVARSRLLDHTREQGNNSNSNGNDTEAS